MNRNKQGFTLIELMTVMTIMGLMIMTVALPYMFYQNKGKVRITQKELAQILYE
jgi:prepilin-type N-terminal cleavage/methylation domain-containing protein